MACTNTLSQVGATDGASFVEAEDTARANMQPPVLLEVEVPEDWDTFEPMDATSTVS